MKRYLLLFLLLAGTYAAPAQSLAGLEGAFKSFENDPQLKSAIASLYVIDANTGKVVFAKNETVGLAPASTQKIITAATTYELLGKNFRYKTLMGHDGEVRDGVFHGNIIIKPSGDPTLGSWRWKLTSDSAILNKWTNIIRKNKLALRCCVLIDTAGWDQERIPDGWIWEDIGNYYGAGPGGFNWRENQFDIILSSSDKIGGEVQVVATKPEIQSFELESKARSAAKGTGDNAYVYYSLQGVGGVVRGTIPVSEKKFSISAAYPDPELEFSTLFQTALGAPAATGTFIDTMINTKFRVLDTHYSPVLDSMIYWFNKRSINLYGEAFIKTIAFEKTGQGSTEEGLKLLKAHWKEKGIDPVELNMVDGSGLSPLNRVTTRAQVQILQYARKQNWFQGYYASLPEFNGMKMKSGTIRGVKGFCGYHRSKDGKEYIFSFLVNNYNGTASALVQKMYKVLDELK